MVDELKAVGWEFGEQARFSRGELGGKVGYKLWRVLIAMPGKWILY